jgi:calcyclin binding protein
MDPTPSDLRELKRLLALATTPYVESVLRSEIDHLSALFPEDPIPAAPPKPAPPRKLYGSIDSYAFSDAKDTARVLINDIDGLTDAVIDFAPTERSFTITVTRDAQGLTPLRLTVSPLKKIVPGESRYTIKGKTITVILKKKKSNTWTKLKKTPSSIKKSKPGEDKTKEDPSAGLMDMMRKMYEEGDDDMKRTMQKAWWEAQHKKDEDKKGKSDD